MTTRVISIDDDRDVPLVGVVLGHEDEHRVWVAWGDSAYADDPHSEARIEWADQLTPTRR